LPSDLSRFKKVPEINTNIYAHIEFNKKIVDARILNLSCWGATIYLKDNIPTHEPFIIRFIYDLDYALHAKIIYKINEHEFKCEFIFTDWYQRETLRRDIK
jgi:uncharacterized protein (DUF1919 family)